MKFSEVWLREWVNPPLSAQQLADQLTMAGLEVESVNRAEARPLNNDPQECLAHTAATDDHVIDLHVTPNRSDCLSVAGIAREVALLNDVRLNSVIIPTITPTIRDEFPITVKASEACPRYLGRIINNLNPQCVTPAWLHERLKSSGVKCIHPIVDITNYVLLELGQPLHAFDLHKLSGGIEVRYAYAQEMLTRLDGQEVALTEDTLVIADQAGAQAIAGIMGGLATAVMDNTTTVFLESAFFAPPIIAGRARRYRLNTDAAYRFERGVDPELPRRALERATDLIFSICGGEAGPITEVVSLSQLPTAQPILLRAARLQRVLGISLPQVKITTLLHRLNMQVQEQAEGWLLLPPGYRFDLSLEEDIIEEIARIYGYDNIPSSVPQVDIKLLPASETQLSKQRISTLLIDKGYREVITYSFISEQAQNLLEPQQPLLQLVNPISNDLAVMRTSLWPGLLNVVAYNQNRQQTRMRLFEIGSVFKVEKSSLMQEPALAGVLVGTLMPEQWGVAKQTTDFFDIKGDLESLFALTQQVEHYSFCAATHPALHPGQCAAIHYKDQMVGYCGALHPSLKAQLKLEGAIYLFELKISAITATALPCFKAISKFPAIRRDLSFWVAQTIQVQELIDTVKTTAGELLVDISLFDVYQGKGVDPGYQSLALGLTLQHRERTLVDSEVNAVVEKVLIALRQAYNIQLRN